MTQDKRKKSGVRTSHSSAKSKTCEHRAKKKLSATLLSLLDTEDELFNIQGDSMPIDVRKWLAVTFTRRKEIYKPEEAANIRTVEYAVQAGVSVERAFRTATSPSGLAYPLQVTETFKDIDKWGFNVFTLNEASEGHSLKFLMCELFSKYNLLTQFKIPITCLISFASALELGYNKYQNPYHNAVHATDVTQTVHTILLHTGIMHWFTDLEILAIIFSTAVHDYEHTGTTNHFHVVTRSEAALLYNDKSVLENHHVSAVYHLIQNEEVNILANLTTDEWRELRRLVIEMVLATDMSQHFRQMNTMKQVLQHQQQMERVHKDKVMSMIVHAADVSHPAKPWQLHKKWAEALMEEFFKQGDKEAALGLPVSSLCDRKTTNIAESQIGFIDVIVKPIFALLLEAIEEIVAPLINEASKSKCHLPSKDIRYDYFWKPEKLPKLETPVTKSETKGGDKGTREESLVTEGKKAKDQESKCKAERRKPQKACKSKLLPSKSKKCYPITPESPIVCHCQLHDSRKIDPVDVNFIVYNADASQLSESQLDADTMDVTESYEELVDNQSSWRKAASQTVEENIKEMRKMVPETKALSPNESDDVIIEEIIPDDPQPQTPRPSLDLTFQNGFLTTDLTQSDMEICSLWNEEVARRAAEQKKQEQSRMPADATLKVAVTGQQSEGSPGSQGMSSGNNDNFVLQIISFDSPPVTCTREMAPKQDPGQQEDNLAPAPKNENITPSNTYQQHENISHGAAAVSVTSLSCGYEVFKIPR
ncbi:hypothetical protein JD844_023431 [Phrynosoma platyrhinos]|uniref:Phosphodiesterase n=1 Tax=Phrynosoma platyrhinos TaxID=52577 RepID=A0ABQ7SWZ1_PHRPL|nr:hypothetical protein JD844_023431 [Phrynosoma platyrhinos]